MFLSPKNLNYLISLAQTFKIFFLFSSLGILVIHKMNLGWPSNLRFSHCVYCHSFDASVFSFFKFFSTLIASVFSFCSEHSLLYHPGFS